MLFRAGIFHMNSANIPFETTFFNARQGYNYAVQNKIPLLFADSKIIDMEMLKAKLHRKMPQAINNREFKIYL